MFLDVFFLFFPEIPISMFWYLVIVPFTFAEENFF